MFHIGIDPGLSGAIAILREGTVHAIHDMPVIAKTHGKGNQVDAATLSLLVRNYLRAQWGDTSGTFHIEQVSAMPGQGVTGMFSLGRTVGVIEGIRACLGVAGYYWRPQQWKKLAGIAGKDKDAAREIASRLYPNIASQLVRKKDDGRAEAILIAHYGQLLAKGEK